MKEMEINWKKEIRTVPNLLSLFRLLLIPVYLHIYLNARTADDYALAGAILAVSCLTDAVDGKIARKYDMITNLGKLLDPFADKLTQFALTVCLASHYPVLNPVLALFVVKESFQLIAVIVHFRKGKYLNGALPAGKVCTTVFFISLIFLVLFPELNRWVVDAVAVMNMIFLSISFLSYIQAYYGKNKKTEDFHAG